MNFPPIPTWESAHPIIVHAPLGALPLAGLLALCAVFSVKSRRAWAGAAMLALIFGTCGTILAAASGDAAEHAAVIPASADRVFHDHEHLAEFTRNVFIAASVLYAILTLGALLWSDRMKRLSWIGGHVLFLGVFAYGFINLAETGHLGGRLVHEFGVHAPIAGSMNPADRAVNTPADDDDDDRTPRKRK